jgi:hypothetical protein
MILSKATSAEWVSDSLFGAGFGLRFPAHGWRRGLWEVVAESRTVLLSGKFAALSEVPTFGVNELLLALAVDRKR